MVLACQSVSHVDGPISGRECISQKKLDTLRHSYSYAVSAPLMITIAPPKLVIGASCFSVAFKFHFRCPGQSCYSVADSWHTSRALAPSS